MLSEPWSHDHGNVSWSNVSREKPCPVCGKPDWCRTAKGGHLVTCRRTTAAPGLWRLLKTTSSGGGVFALDDGLGVRTFQPRTISTAPVQARPAAALPAAWGERAKAWQTAAGDQVQVLAESLGVDAASLRAIGCGWDKGKRAWTFPVRDGVANVVGIAQRFDSPRLNREGKTITKAMVTGSRTGLFFDPRNWSQGNGPILLVEGASDTAAAMTMGLAVVGRPSNRGGLDHLALLLLDVPASRPILVVGERDQKPDGNWPGRDGATSTAQQLAVKLHREVGWAMVPDGAKDTREFLQGVTGCLGDGVDLRRIGRGLAETLLHDAAWIAGPPAPVMEPAAPPAGPARDLASWRRDVAAARLEAVARPGLHLDRSQTGAGKTYATMQAIRQASRSLIVLPTHENVRERVQEMQAAGIDALAFPQLDETNCRNFTDASRAQAAGLSVGQSVCVGCQFKAGCEYRDTVAKAKKSPHGVATHERLIRSPRVADDCAVVVIDENPVAVLQPSLAASPQAVAAVGDMAHRLMYQAGERGDASGVMTFARSLAQVCDSITAAMRQTEPGRYPVDLPDLLAVPDHWQAVLWRAMRRAEVVDPDSEALQLVTRAATGELDRLEVVVERTASGLLSHLAFGAWRTPIDTDAVSYQLLDATADAETVAAVAGRDVTDCTPEGFLPALQTVTQIPLAITSRTSPAKVAGIIRAIMERHSQFQRVGLIGHSAHIRAIMAEGSDLLDADTRSRIAKACYFWQGPDRASNDWHQVCDVVLVLGVPRPNPVAVRQRLLLTGQDEAATIPNPVWGDRHWQAQTVDGGLVTIPGRGYHPPAWHHAHASLCRSQLLQSMGRARSVLPDGVPCLVVADEPTGAAVDTRPLQLLPAAVQELVAVIRRLGERQLPRIGSPNTEKLSSPPVATRDLLADPVFSGMTRQALTKRLDQARKLGAVHSPGRGLWAVSQREALPMPMTITGPVEPITTAVAMADPIPAATIRATTADAQPDAAVDLLELVEERAAMLEFDAGLDRDQAERQALDQVAGTGRCAAPVSELVAAGFTVQPARPRGPTGPQPTAAPAAKPASADRHSFPATGPSQGGLWTPAQLRQLNPWG